MDIPNTHNMDWCRNVSNIYGRFDTCWVGRLLIFYKFVPESYAPVLLKRKAQK
jgi:hypothetical protein